MTGARNGIGLRALAGAWVAIISMAGCGGPAKSPLPTSPMLVAEPASAFDVIRVTATGTGRAAVAPDDVRSGLAPLISARRFTAAGSLSDYGLDKPLATIDYLQGPVTIHRLVVGGTDFDAHGFYVQRPGDPAVYLVLWANLHPALELVGVVTPVPS